jgi:hypothetical protein
MNKLLQFTFIIVISFVIFSCNKSTPTTANPVIIQANSVTVNLTVTLSSYPTLRTIGGTAYIPNVGVKGILVYRASQLVFYAFERDCTFDGNTYSNAKVWVYNTTNCRDSVCGSIYTMSNGQGSPTAPASVGLKAYYITYDDSNNTITITN